MEILLIDNYDSFTYNLVHMLEANVGVKVSVRRNDQIELSEVEKFSKIILSPGPGIPSEAGLMPEIVKVFAATKIIFGVCLGHQCIGEVFGAKLLNLAKPIHGKATEIMRLSERDPVLAGLPERLSVGRYHSWVVDRSGFPKDLLEITAVDSDGEIMALRHRELPIYGVQFHPESILTERGEVIMRNVLAL